MIRLPARFPNPVALLAACAMLLLLGACATAPGLPETTYYRLPDAAPVTRLPAPLIELPITVEPLSADGLYSDRALIWSPDADGGRLRTYHYQLWIDPPVRLLQRRLLGSLRELGITRVVADRLPAQLDALNISGRIARLERLQTGDGWQIAVALVLRADPSGGGRPWVIGRYQRQLPVQGDTVADSVRTIGQALDQIQTEFFQDLVERASQPDTNTEPKIR